MYIAFIYNTKYDTWYKYVYISYKYVIYTYRFGRGEVYKV